MTTQELTGVMEQTMWATLYVAGPIVLAALVVGLLVSILQAATQINEATLTFVPKVIVVAVLMVVFGPSMIQQLVDFTVYVFNFAATVGPVHGG